MISRIPLFCAVYYCSVSTVFAQNQLVEAIAPQYDAVLINSESSEVVSGVASINRRRNQHTASDTAGHFSIRASVPDTLILLDRRYVTRKKLVRSNTQADTIFLMPRVNQLKTVEKLSGYALYRKDSAENRILYRKAIADAKRKPVAKIDTPMLTVKIYGLFTEIAQRVSGKKKRDRALLRTIEKGDQEGYTALKYTTKNVKRILQVNDSQASDFIRRYPIPYTFCVQASELEIYRWIEERSLMR
jgi:hypothetical protein